jgi:hypothetical protein
MAGLQNNKEFPSDGLQCFSSPKPSSKATTSAQNLDQRFGRTIRRMICGHTLPNLGGGDLKGSITRTYSY